MSLKKQIKKVFDDGLANTPAVRLSVEEANYFIDAVVDESALFKRCKVVRIAIGKASKKVNKIKLDDDVFHPAESGTALPSQKYATAKNDGYVVLRPLEIIATVKINDDELEENVEGLAFEDHFMAMVAKQGANQLERVALYSRKKSTIETTYDMFDGFITLAKASGNVIDFSVVYSDRYIDRNKMSAMYKAIPTKFRKALTDYFMHDDLKVDYEDLYIQSQNRVPTDQANGKPFSATPWLNTEAPVATGTVKTIASNATAGTDTITMTGGHGIVNGNVIVIAYGKAKEFSTVVTNVATNVLTLQDELPYDYASGNADENKVYLATLDGSDVLLAGVDNLLVGISRDMTMEFERVARERATYAVITMKVDFNVMYAQAIAIGKSLKVR